MKSLKQRALTAIANAHQIRTGFPTYEDMLADGTKLTAEEVVEQIVDGLTEMGGYYPGGYYTTKAGFEEMQP